MNMPFPSREQVEFIRKNYPPGTRVMLNNMNDPYSPAYTVDYARREGLHVINIARSI